MKRALAAYALLVTVAVALSTGWVYHQAGQIATIRGENTTLTEALSRAEKQRKADARVLARRAASNAVAAQRAASAGHLLEDSLRAERVWADEPVPEAVRKLVEVAE